MKKILSVFLVALMLLGMLPWAPIHAQAAENSATLALNVAGNRTSFSTSQQVWSANGITVTNNKSSSTSNVADYTPPRFYAKSELSVECSLGNITKIEFLCNSSSYATAMVNSAKGAGATASSSGNTATVTLDGTSNTFTISSMTAQVRMGNSITVYYQASTPSCQHTNTTENSDGYAATCTTPGKTNSVVCDDCGETVTPQKEIPATGHNYVDGVCKNCNHELPVISFVVPQQVSAVPSISPEGAVELPGAENYTGKYEYTFAGWAAASVTETTEAPVLYAEGASFETEENVTLYAVYTRTESGGGEPAFVKTDLTAISATDVVVIVATKTGTNAGNYAMTNDNGTGSAPAASAVTVSGDQLSGTIAENLKWNISSENGKYTIYPNGSTSSWLYCTGTNNGVRVGTNTNKTFTLDSSGYLKHESTSRYLGVYNKQDWRCYTSPTATNITGQTFTFYVLTGGNTTYYTSILEDNDTTCQHTNTTTTTVEPGCTTAGSVTVTCDDCGEQISKTETQATGHTAVVDAGKEPTCVDSGLTEGSHCSVCDEVIKAQEEIPATGEHNYVSGYCTVCGEKKSVQGWQLVTSADEIYAGGQFVIVGSVSETENYALSNAIANKMSGVSVTVQGDKVVFVENETPVWTVEYINGASFALTNGTAYLKYASGTDLGSNGSKPYAWTLATVNDNTFKVVAGTDSTRGLVYRAASYDQFGGYALSNVSGTSAEYFGIRFYKLVNLCGHENTESVAEIPATCTTVGYTAGKQCADCGAYTEGHVEIPVIPHDYGSEITTKPTCTEEGVKTYTCTVCGHSYTETVAATGHTMGDAVIVEPTCEEEGSKTFVCTVCGEEQKETLSAIGHSWDEGEVTTQATCETDGEMTFTCQNNREHTKTEVIEAIGHNWDAGVTTVEPTCDVPGETLYTCLNDSSHTKTEVIHPLGHQYSGGICSVCGKEVSRFQLVTDYTEILAGGEYIIAARVGDDFYAIDGGDSFKQAYPLTVDMDNMEVIYADGLPYWNIQYYLGRNNCVSLYNSAAGQYLTGTDGTGLSQDAKTPWAWTFADGSNANGQETDKVFAVDKGDGTVAFVLASATVSDRAISLRGTEDFVHYSRRTDGYNRELYFFKLVRANVSEYTVNFVENGTTTMTQTVPANDNGIKMPQPTGNAMPEGYTNFVGWVAVPHTESMEAPATIYSAQEGDGFNNTAVITEDMTFYALYSREDPNGEGQMMDYHLVTNNDQLVVGQNYIIVGQDKSGTYYAMSKDQLSGDRGASVVVPDENGVISFVPGDNVAAFELTQGSLGGTFAFLDLAMNQFLYCASSDSENTLKSQASLDEKASFQISIVTTEDGSYSIMISQISTSASTRTNLMFNTIDTNSKMFSCYDPNNTTVDQTKTFLYVGVPNSTFATYYTTGLCNHSWIVKESQKAECETPGYTLYACSICGEVKVEDMQAHGHDVGESTVTKEPTCTTTGIATSTCKKCEKTFEEILPALGHTEVTDAAVAPGCETTGLTQGSHCSVCDTVLVPQQEVAALGHQYEAVITEPDCVNGGYTTHTCSACGASYVTDEVPALGHEYEGTGGYYTHEKGFEVPRITYTCIRCEDSYYADLMYNAANVELKNTLIINFRASEEIAQHFTNIRAEFIYGNRVGEYQLPPVKLENATHADGRYAFPCRYITPSQVGDTVYAYLYGTYDGVEYCFTMEYGVATYCYNQLENTTDDELQTLLVDLLYYCDYARVYTNYKADEPVTANLTDEQKAMASTDSELKSILNGKHVVIDSPVVSWKGANLALNHATRMQIRFAMLDDTNVSELTVRATIDGKPIAAYIVESPDYTGYYTVMIEEIAAHQMSDVVCVTLYHGDTAVSNTVCYSVESYACAKQNDQNVKLANLVKAMMRYGRSAKAYLES